MIGESRIALIAARTKNPKATTFSSEKARLSDSSKTPDEAPANADVAGILDALKGVVPIAISGVYTAAVVVTRGLAQTQGASDRAEVQTKLAQSGQSEEVIKKMLQNLPDESKHLVILRWLLIAVAMVAVVVAMVDAADKALNGKKKRFPLAEVLTAELAFIGWALAMPGTPLAAYHSPANLSAITIFIAASAALLVGAAGKLVLTKPQTGTGTT